jgi:hypothetical protein
MNASKGFFESLGTVGTAKAAAQDYNASLRRVAPMIRHQSISFV